jgi:hypothetical protein
VISSRRFPPPWIAEETDACFIVRDANGQALAYVYFEEELDRRSAAHLLTRDEARRWTAAFRGQTCSVTKPKALSAWWILVTPTSLTMASLELTIVSMLFVAMKYSLPWKLK